MKTIYILCTLFILSYKYSQRFTSKKCCPYCKSKDFNEEFTLTNTPFKLLYKYFKISTYSCKSCLNNFHQLKTKNKTLLGYSK